MDVQNFGQILRTNVPIVPEAVQMGPSVQTFNQVLEHIDDGTGRRRSARLQEHDRKRGTNIDYKIMNSQGKTEKGGRLFK